MKVGSYRKILDFKFPNSMEQFTSFEKESTDWEFQELVDLYFEAEDIVVELSRFDCGPGELKVAEGQIQKIENKINFMRELFNSDIFDSEEGDNKKFKRKRTPPKWQIDFDKVYTALIEDLGRLPEVEEMIKKLRDQDLIIDEIHNPWGDKFEFFCGAIKSKKTLENRLSALKNDKITPYT